MEGLGQERYERIVALLTPWFRELQRAMGLEAWHIDFITKLDRLPDEQGSGGIYRFIGQRAAEIYLSEWSLGTHTPQEVKLTILHEMVHCHTQPMWEEHRHLSRQLGEMVWSLLGPAYSSHEENIADGLANVIGKWLPDPPDWRHLLSETMQVEYSQEGVTVDVPYDHGDGEVKPIGIVQRMDAIPDPAPVPVPDEMYVPMPAEEGDALAMDDSPRTKKRPR